MGLSILGMFALCGGMMLAGACAAAKPYGRFGEPLKLAPSSTISVEQLLASRAAYDGKFVRVSGLVDDVCQSKGCWLTLTDGKDVVRVKFTCPVEGRLIPMAAVGRRAIVEGLVTVSQIPEEEARHYAEESGKSAAEIAAIVGPQEQVAMAGPAASIEGLTAPQAKK